MDSFLEKDFLEQIRITEKLAFNCQVHNIKRLGKLLSLKRSL